MEIDNKRGQMTPSNSSTGLGTLRAWMQKILLRVLKIAPDLAKESHPYFRQINNPIDIPLEKSNLNPKYPF
jgi:hypothetical protein